MPADEPLESIPLFQKQISLEFWKSYFLKTNIRELNGFFILGEFLNRGSVLKSIIKRKMVLTRSKANSYSKKLVMNEAEIRVNKVKKTEKAVSQSVKE